MARIGVNALYLIPGGVGGTEIYLRELLKALALFDTENEYFVFTNFETADLVPKRANFHWKPQAVHARVRPARILWEQVVLPMEAARYRLDVLFNPGFTAPLLCGCRVVTVFHDLQHKRHPEYFRWFDLPFWRLLLWASARRSQKLIAVSEATRSDLLTYYPFTRNHVEVIPHGVEAAFFEIDRSRIDPYVLCVSTLHPHKNLERLIRAYARRRRDFRLVIAGVRGFHTGPLEALIEGLGVKRSVELTGWIPRADLLQLYARARSFIYPSTFEGFGMPVLEAMAAGLPVACSDIPPLREVGGDTVSYFDPHDEDAIAASLEEPPHSAAARERARGFTWEQTALRTLQELLRN
jgi:glycosyltransferase involved in cell wall biosynthesis